MALASASLQSHITPDSSASLFRASAARQSDSGDSIPRFLEQHEREQKESCLAKLPAELEQLILSLCSKQTSPQALLKFGLTSRYWHLRVRNFIEDDREGTAFRRNFHERKFVERFGKTPAAAAKNDGRELLPYGVRYEPGAKLPDHIIPILKTSTLPVVLRTPWIESWSPALEDAIANRSGCLTVFDSWPCAPSSEMLTKAAQAIPEGAYMAVKLPRTGIPAEHSQAFAQTIKTHPVVCSVHLDEDGPVEFHEGRPNRLEAARNLSLLKACADNQVEGVTFVLDYKAMTKEDAEQLGAVIRRFKTEASIEIRFAWVLKENLAPLFEAVRARNKNARTTVKLTCISWGIQEAMGEIDKKKFALEGMFFLKHDSMNHEESIDDNSLVSDPDSED